MPLPSDASDSRVLRLLTVALEALDQEGDAVSAAYVSMALARVEEQTQQASVA